MAQLARHSVLLQGPRHAVNLATMAATQSQLRTLTSTAVSKAREDQATSSGGGPSSDRGGPGGGSAGRNLRRGGGGRRGQQRLSKYEEWIKTDGKAYEKTPPGRGPFWLGATPFPMNPYFVPQPPTAHSIKSTMWLLHTTDPVANSVRNLSNRFGIAAERVVAILRLMALENEFQQRERPIPLQMPFQKEMERLMGSMDDPELIRRESESLKISPPGRTGARHYEELGLGESELKTPSAINPLLREMAQEKRDRIRRMATGGPAAKGPALESVHVANVDSRGKQRAEFTFVDLSNRPTSYNGTGVVERNVKRAEQRKANKDRRRAADVKWQERTALAEKFKAGESSPEMIARKRELDEEKHTEDLRVQAALRKQFKSARRLKKALKRVKQLDMRERDANEQKAAAQEKRAAKRGTSPSPSQEPKQEQPAL